MWNCCRNGNSRKPHEAHLGEEIPAAAHPGSGRGGVVASLTGELARLRRLIVSRSEELWLRLLSTVQATSSFCTLPFKQNQQAARYTVDVSVQLLWNHFVFLSRCKFRVPESVRSAKGACPAAVAHTATSASNTKHTR